MSLAGEIKTNANFIREAKNGFDLNYFPWQKLIANKAYGLIGMFAYALMPYMGFLLDPAQSRLSYGGGASAVGETTG